MDPAEFKKRTRAARELAGIRSHAEFAKKIAQRGLSASNLRAMERGERPVGRADKFAIADACGLVADWFDIDIAAAVRTYALSEEHLQARKAFVKATAAAGERIGSSAPGQPQDPAGHHREDQAR